MKLRDTYNYYVHYRQEPQIDTDVEEHSEIRYYSSHGLLPKVVTPKLKEGDFYFTSIRHPLSVFHSAYFYFGISERKSDNHVDPEMKKRNFYDYIDYRLVVPPKWLWRWMDLDYDAFHFVGVLEELDTTYKMLNHRLGLNLKNNTHHNPTSDYMGDKPHYKDEYDLSYRREELIEMFNPLIQTYNGCVKKLTNDFSLLETPCLY